MDCKQHDLIRTILDRIFMQEYTDKLPRAVDLAEEFQVNVKTVNKAILHLVKRGILERKRRGGTYIVSRQQNTPEPVVEVLFDGFMSIFSHPFWHHIWEAMIQELDAGGFRAILTILKSDPQTGLMSFDHKDFYPLAEGRIILGSYEKLFLDRAAETKVPFITAGDQLDPAIPQVSFDFTDGIHDAVKYLHQQGCRKIGFIGQTQSLIQPRHLNKFHAYLNSIQDYCQVDPACIGNTRPVPGGGAAALRKILECAAPDALIAAYDHQLPEILQLLDEKKIKIPVIGCDGLDLPNIPPNRPVVRAPLRECGKLAAEKIILAIRKHRMPKSAYLKAEFDPGK